MLEEEWWRDFETEGDSADTGADADDEDEDRADAGGGSPAEWGGLTNDEERSVIV